MNMENAKIVKSSVSNTSKPSFGQNLVSIGMPTYNRAHLLKRSLDSLLAQTYKNFELIISDDGSIDDTEKICTQYMERDKRIRYVRHPKNIGHVVNFEYVMRQANGDYFMWAADDDYWDKTFIEKLLGALEKNPKVNLAMSSLQRFFSDGEMCDTIELSGACDLNNKGHIELSRFLPLREAVHQAIYGVWRRPFLEKLFSRPKPDGIHWDGVFMREAVMGTRIASVPEILFFKDQSRIPLKKRYKTQALGQAYHAPFSYSLFLLKLLIRPLTSSVIPWYRKLVVPFLWLETVWIDRKRIIWDFVRAGRRLVRNRV